MINLGIENNLKELSEANFIEAYYDLAKEVGDTLKPINTNINNNVFSDFNDKGDNFKTTTVDKIAAINIRIELLKTLNITGDNENNDKARALHRDVDSIKTTLDKNIKILKEKGKKNINQLLKPKSNVLAKKLADEIEKLLKAIKKALDEDTKLQDEKIGQNDNKLYNETCTKFKLDCRTSLGNKQEALTTFVTSKGIPKDYLHVKTVKDRLDLTEKEGAKTGLEYIKQCKNNSAKNINMAEKARKYKTIFDNLRLST